MDLGKTLEFFRNSVAWEGMQPLPVELHPDELFDVRPRMFQVEVFVSVDFFPLLHLDEVRAAGVIEGFARRLMLGAIPHFSTRPHAQCRCTDIPGPSDAPAVKAVALSRYAFGGAGASQLAWVRSGVHHVSSASTKSCFQDSATFLAYEALCRRRNCRCGIAAYLTCPRLAVSPKRSSYPRAPAAMPRCWIAKSTT